MGQSFLFLNIFKFQTLIMIHLNQVGHLIYNSLVHLHFLFKKKRTFFFLSVKTITYFSIPFEDCLPSGGPSASVFSFGHIFCSLSSKSDFIDAMMPHSILIVEDEKIVREGLARALSHSYKTFQAANGKAAMEIIDRNNDIVVVVSDLKMPEVNGFELLEKIRTDNKEVDVIFVTAFFSIESAVDAMRRGAFDYMTKPVDIRKLEETIQKAIERKKI